MSVAPQSQGQPLVVVHLSEVPEQVRVRVANRMIRVAGLEGTAAIELQIAAFVPRQNPAIEVTRDEYDKVFHPRRRKRAS
jgi:hypothetical protein